MEREEDMHEEWKGFTFGQSPKRNSSIPPDYFEQLPDRIMARWGTERTSVPGIRINIWQMIASAAIVTGLSFGIVWFTKVSTQLNPSFDISSAEAYQYIMEHISEFAPLMHESELWAEEINEEVPSASGIEEYLIEELDGEQLETIF